MKKIALLLLVAAGSISADLEVKVDIENKTGSDLKLYHLRNGIACLLREPVPEGTSSTTLSISPDQLRNTFNITRTRSKKRLNKLVK